MPSYTINALAWPADVALHDMCATAKAALGGSATVGATYNSGTQTLILDITGASPTQQQVDTAVRGWTAKTSQQLADAAMQADLTRVLAQIQTVRTAIDGASNVTGLKLALAQQMNLIEKIVRYIVAQEKV